MERFVFNFTVQRRRNVKSALYRIVKSEVEFAWKISRKLEFYAWRYMLSQKKVFHVYRIRKCSRHYFCHHPANCLKNTRQIWLFNGEDNFPLPDDAAQSRCPKASISGCTIYSIDQTPTECSISSERQTEGHWTFILLKITPLVVMCYARIRGSLQSTHGSIGYLISSIAVTKQENPIQ